MLKYLEFDNQFFTLDKFTYLCYETKQLTRDEVLIYLDVELKNSEDIQDDIGSYTMSTIRFLCEKKVGLELSRVITFGADKIWTDYDFMRRLANHLNTQLEDFILNDERILNLDKCVLNYLHDIKSTAK